ncbi:MAG: beta-CASP ribonuclease aCPSF1 [Nanoarchaeota archaeon]
MNELLKEVLKYIPEDAEIVDSGFEGANIVLYTKSKEFLLNNNNLIKEIVNKIKKRIELRPDPSLLMQEEKAEKEIRKLIPNEAGLGNIIFDAPRSKVILEAEKPGLVIGKSGELLKEIRRKTFWIPHVRRSPPIRSPIIEKIRKVLYEHNDYRKKFLNKVGERIYGGWTNAKKDEWIRVTFLGGARQVGRSCILLQTQESSVLLDCGIDVSAKDEENSYPILNIPEFNLDKLDAIIVTHPHVDHSAFVPYLYKMGYRGPTYFTLPGRDVAALMALDYISVAQKEGRKTIFSSTDIKEMIKHSITLEYDEVSDITPDIRVTFYDAGHTLGSAMVHLNIGNGLHNLLYTADMNYETSNLLNSAVTRFPRLETMILESTYGGRNDNYPSRREAEQQLFDMIKKTLERGGKVLMPVLGTGRAQEIMVIIEKAVRNGMLDKIPVYIQGIVWDITAIHTAYPDFFNSNIKKLIFHKDQNPFLNEIFKRIGSRKEMMQVVEGGPCVILATSGMMVGGASVEYFKLLADNPKNSIVFSSYLGKGTLGRKISEGEKEISLDGETIKVNMEVAGIRGFTGHSTRERLISFVKHLDPRPKKIILVHGDNSNCLDIASTLHKIFRIETNAPKNLESIRIK